MLKLPPNNSEEDNTAWEEATKDVKKFSPQEVPPSAPVILPPIKPTINIAKAYREEDLSELKLGNTDNIDANTAKRFKRGDFPIEARLDLHGYHEDEAREAVFDFVQKAYIEGKRCIIIITGKGLSHNEGNDNILIPKGKLKESVPLWLNSKNLRPLILAYNHPPAKLGGSGALYIMLRRQR